MTMTSVNATIRRADMDDLPLICRAMESMPHDVQKASVSEVAASIREGDVAVYVLETEGAVTTVAVQRDDGSYAQFAGLYREGRPEGLLRDCRLLLAYIIPRLANDGVRHIGLQVSVNNPLFGRLHKFYNRLGFSTSAITMCGEIGGLL